MAFLPQCRLWPEAQLLEREAAEEKTSWSVLLRRAVLRRFRLLRCFGKQPALVLRIKDMVDAAPKVVKEGLKKEDAEELKKT